MEQLTRHLLPSEIDLLLDDEEGFGVAPLRAHIDQCPSCRAELDAGERLVRELEGLPQLAPSPLFATRVLAHVQVFEPWYVAALDTVRRYAPRSLPARLFAGGAATAVGLALTAAAVWLWTQMDIVLFVADVARVRAREALIAGFWSVAGAAFGDSALQGWRGTGPAGLFFVALALVMMVAGAGLGLRTLVRASRIGRT